MISHARRWTPLQLSCVVSHCIPIATLLYLYCTTLHCTVCSFFMTIELHHRNFLQEFATTVQRERESEEEQAERNRGKIDGEYVDIEMQCDIDIYAKEEDSRIDARHIDAHLVSVVWICSYATTDTSSASYYLLCCTLLY